MNETQSLGEKVMIKVEFPKIKKRYFVILLILIALFITNPTEKEFFKYIENKYDESTSSDVTGNNFMNLNKNLNKYIKIEMCIL